MFSDLASPLRTPTVFGRPFPALLVTAFVLFLSGCGSSQPAPREEKPPTNVVATFAGETLTFEQLKDRFSRSISVEADSTSDADAYVDFLERYVNFRLKVMSARALEMDIDSATTAELASYRRQLARPYLVERRVMDSLITDLYEKQAVEIQAGHILALIPPGGTPADTLAAYDKIHAVYDSLQSGAEFTELALRNSDDPSVRQNQGVLGYFTGGRLIYRFEDEAYATPVGEYSEPFRTQFGYHIVKVFDRRPYHPSARASHILISTQDKSPEEALEIAQSLKARIDSGEDFATLAREYSNDPGSAENGGELGPIPHGRTVPPFEEALFNLEVGEVSDPVQTRFGYHLIHLTALDDRASYAESYDELKALINRLPRLRDSELLIGREYRDRLGSAVDTLALDRLMAGMPEDSLFFYLRTTIPDSSALEAEVGRIADESYTGGDFLQYLRSNRTNRPPSSRAEIYGWMHDYLDAQAINVAATRLEDLNPEFAELMREYEEGILLFAISEDSVWDAAARDTVALERIFAANPDRYTFPERRRVISVSTTIDSTMQDLRSTLESGADLSTALAGLTQQPADLRVDTTFIADSTRSFYDAALDLPPGEFTAPTPFQGRWVMLYVDGIEAPRAKTFTEARSEIVSLLQEDLEDAWVDRLRARYNVQTYPEHVRLSLQADRGGMVPDGSPTGASSGDSDR